VVCVLVSAGAVTSGPNAPALRNASSCGSTICRQASIICGAVRSGGVVAGQVAVGPGAGAFDRAAGCRFGRPQVAGHQVVDQGALPSRRRGGGMPAICRYAAEDAACRVQRLGVQLGDAGHDGPSV
jgi:hypothetical protein